MSTFLAMMSFSFAMSISPGPVNMIILSSGVNYGVKKTLSYILGATVGFTLLLLTIGFVFEQFIHRFPYFLNYLSITGALYIIYLGYKIASSSSVITTHKGQIPKFHHGFLLQWLNPKAWIACISGMTLFAKPDSLAPFLTFTTIYFIVCYASLFTWAVLGDKMSILLNNHLRLRLFNVAIGGMLMVTAVYLI